MVDTAHGYAPMNRIKIALVAPSGTFSPDLLERALMRARVLGFDIVQKTDIRGGSPAFLNGSKSERLNEFDQAERAAVDAIWCVRGGCGAVELWPHLIESSFFLGTAPLIGYSDITIYHFLRYLRAGIIGIHGPVFLDLAKGETGYIEALALLVRGQAERLIYPALTNLTHSLTDNITGTLVPMNLASLQSIVGCFHSDFFHGKILAIEDVNEPPYKVFRVMHQLRNAGMFAGLKALVVGYFGEQRQQIIEETMLPLANQTGLPLFDWPIFGHEQPNWPLLFGARVSIKKVDRPFFTLSYQEQYDHKQIEHDAY